MIAATDRSTSSRSVAAAIDQFGDSRTAEVAIRNPENRPPGDRTRPGSAAVAGWLITSVASRARRQISPAQHRLRWETRRRALSYIWLNP